MAITANADPLEVALTSLIMDCPELLELEAQLSRFNIFRVLKADRHEIRHSNMLAWLLNPDESHGLEDRFLRRWLMKVVHDANTQPDTTFGLPSPIEIDSLDIEYVEVAREHENIDLLLILTTTTDVKWIVCIENKVESSQHSGQLHRYHEYVERKFAKASHRLYVFLTKYSEAPENAGFITSSYEVIRNVLQNCILDDGAYIRPAPKVLLDQYLELLSEDFVDDSKAAQLARQIYQTHRKAIDFILENRKDPISELSSLMAEILKSRESDLAIVLTTQNKGWVRFVPVSWDVGQNSGGTAWGPNSRIVVCEISFWTKNVELHITLGKAPNEWADMVWARAAQPPFKQEWKKRPTQYIKPYKAKSDISVENLSELAPEDARKSLSDWIEGELRKPKFIEAQGIIKDFLLLLKDQ